jgi:DNA-binding SARP family transcriptional activator
MQNQGGILPASFTRFRAEPRQAILAATMDFQVLGPLEAVANGVRVDLGRRQERRLLGLLLLETGRLVTADRLVALLWDDTVPSNARGALHTHAARLRSRLASYGIRLESRSGAYRLDLAQEAVDAFRFTRLTAQASALEEPAERAAKLGEALSLWRGVLLADVLTDAVRDRLGSHLDSLRMQAIEQKAMADLTTGRHGQVVMEVSVVLQQHPAREHLASLLMLALYRCGRQAEALEVYRRTRQHLVDMVGIEPAPELQRLHEQILRNQVPPAGTGALSKTDLEAIPRQLPLNVRGFTGRSNEIEQLDAMLAGTGHAGTANVVIVSGMGGVGKTSLAVYWAHRVQEHFPDGQLYLDLRGFDPSGAPVPPADALRRLLDAFGLPAARIPTTADAQAGLYRTLLANRRALILLDNARDADQVRPLLPGNSGCGVVITSRDQLAGLVAAEGAILLPVAPLPAGDARGLLAARLQTRRLEAEPHAVAEIIESCAHLPLALTIVAAQAAARPHASLEQIAAALRHTGRPLDAFDVGDATTDVRRVFSWSYRSLSAAGARMFGLLALHPGPDAALAAIASLAGQSPDLVEEQLTELIRHHLIVRNGGRYGFHDLVRAYALEVVESSPERDAAIRRVLSHYLHSAQSAAMRCYPTRDPLPLPDVAAGVTVALIQGKEHALAWFSAEYQAILAAIRFSAGHGFGEFTPRLSWTLESFFDSRGLWRDWLEIDTIALDAAHRVKDTLGQAIAHRSLARVTSRLASYGEAEQHCLQAELLFAQLDDPAGLAHTHVSHGFVTERLGRLDETLAHTEKALALFRAAGHIVGEGRALNNLGWHHALRGQYDLALGYCHEAVMLQGKTGNRTSEANAWDSLGYIHLQRGAFGDAIGCYERALSLHREDGNRVEEAETWESISEIHIANGSTGSAVVALQSAMAILHDIDPAAAARIQARIHHLSQALR